MVSKKVLLFTDTFCDANGVSRFIQDVAILADRGGLPLNVVCVTSKERCVKPDNAQIIKPSLRMKMPFYPELDLVFPPFFKLRKIIKEQRPDIIHISTPGPVGFTALVLAKIYGIPRAGVYHTDFPAYVYENTKKVWLKGMTTFFMRFFYKNFSALFVRSEAYKRSIVEDLRFPEEKVHTLQPGTDTVKFNPAFKDNSIWEKFDVDQDGLKVLYTGRITKEKSIPFLLDLWVEFFKKHTTFKLYLILVGNGEYESRADELYPYGVRFLGFRGGVELSQIYASSDLFIFPSTTDTLGQVVMEAMASGVPTVVSDVGGPKTIVAKESFILRAEDQVQWMEALSSLATDEGLRETQRQAAFKKSKTLSIKSSFEHYWQVHQAIVTIQYP
jgi:glycosyltransferase involved in cell wall biosynthesis